MFWVPYIYYLVSFLHQLWEACKFSQFYWWAIWKQKYYVTYPKIHDEEISELGFKHRFVLLQSLFFPLVTFHFAFQSVPLNRQQLWVSLMKAKNSGIRTGVWNLDQIKLPWWLRWWRIHLQCRRLGFNPWVWKIPWRRVFSCLENSMNRGAWQATIHGVSKESNITEWLILT